MYHFLFKVLNLIGIVTPDFYFNITPFIICSIFIQKTGQYKSVVFSCLAIHYWFSSMGKHRRRISCTNLLKFWHTCLIL